MTFDPSKPLQPDAVYGEKIRMDFHQIVYHVLDRMFADIVSEKPLHNHIHALYMITFPWLSVDETEEWNKRWAKLTSKLDGYLLKKHEKAAIQLAQLHMLMVALKRYGLITDEGVPIEDMQTMFGTLITPKLER